MLPASDMQNLLAFALPNKFPNLFSHESFSFPLLKALGPEGRWMGKEELGVLVLGFYLLR
jgi:hypothetical protein